MRNQIIISVLTLGLSCIANAKNDGSDLPQCKGVTDVCMAAKVSAKDSKSGKEIKGYQFGEHGRDGKGLWADCVKPLAKDASVEGVSGVTAPAAQACLDAEKATHGKGKGKSKSGAAQ